MPAHVQIERWLQQAITAGEMATGDRLPGERELAAELGVSRMTLRQALATLEGRGVLIRVPGRSGGAFVAEPRIECDLTGLAGFTEQLRRSDLTAHATVLVAVTRAAGDSAAALEIGRDEPVHEIVRVRSAGTTPIALERSAFPAARLPDLLKQDLSGSLYEILERRELAPHHATEYLDPVIPTPDEAGHLATTPGTPLMRIERTVYTAAGIPVEHARDLFRPDRVRISVQCTSQPRGAPSAGRQP
ncbi:MAG: GntR family transcriptional regulator [Nonomuraea sp.]|nr:GntR family transcriptional regulator [Nonomuraea sp.]